MKKTILSFLVVYSLVLSASDTTESLIEVVGDTGSSELVTHTEIGYINTSGNTKTETFTMDMKIKKEFDKHIFAALFQAKYSKENRVESGNNFLGELGYDYKFSKLFSLNYLLGYKRDKFSSFEYQLYTGPGFKYLAINNSKVHNLNFTLSYLYSVDQKVDLYNDLSQEPIEHPFVDADGNDIIKTKYKNGEKSDYDSARISLEYRLKISKDLRFNQDATYRQDLSDSDKYFAYSKTTISSKIAENLSAGLSYKLDYTNLVDEGIERTDKILTANLIIDY
jgi:putative salt-induced outer membrane protein